MSIAGMTLEEYCDRCGGPARRTLPEVMRGAFDREVRRAADRVIAWKGATYYAIAVAVRRIAQAVLRDERCILTVSSRLSGEYGLSGVCLSLPAWSGARGCCGRLPPDLAPGGTGRSARQRRRGQEHGRADAEGVFSVKAHKGVLSANTMPGGMNMQTSNRRARFGRWFLLIWALAVLQ